MRYLPPVSFLSVVLLSLGTVAAQNPAMPAGQDLQVQLTSTIKAKKAKVGDTVNAITVTSITLPKGVVVPAQTKVVGHVRKVEADSADTHNSFITVSFDEIDIKKGQTVPLNCFVRAAMMPTLKGVYDQEKERGQNLPPITTGRGISTDAATVGSMGTAGGVSQTTPYNDSRVAQPQPTEPGQDESKPVTAHTGQLIGMPGVELQVNVPGHLSTFKSDRKNLELDEGMQLMLVVQQ